MTNSAELSLVALIIVFGAPFPVWRLAPPFAYRRIGMTTTVLPGREGRPRAFAREQVTPLAALTSWAVTLERQAGEGTSRLRELQIYGGLVERQLSEVRRPATFRRLVAATFGSWSVRAATLARDTRVKFRSRGGRWNQQRIWGGRSRCQGRSVREAMGRSTQRRPGCGRLG